MNWTKYVGGSAPVVLMVVATSLGDSNNGVVALCVGFIAYLMGWVDGSSAVYRYTAVDEINKVRARSHTTSERIARLGVCVAIGSGIGRIVRGMIG